MFANIRDIKSKEVWQLKKLRAMGLNGLSIGTESGDNNTLFLANKGYTSQDILEQCQKLDEAGEKERLIALQAFIKNLQIRTYLFANSKSNFYPLSAYLPKERETIVNEIRQSIMYSSSFSSAVDLISKIVIGLKIYGTRCITHFFATAGIHFTSYALPCKTQSIMMDFYSKEVVSMINIAICDDEIFMLDELSEMVSNFFKSENMEVTIIKFSNGSSLLQYNKHLDIIFLDIQMNELNGMETAKKLRNQNYKGFLIFVTVMEELVFHSFEVRAFDYLIKPIDTNRFTQTIKRLLSDMQNCSDTSLLVRKGNECNIIPFDDIIYCEIINRKIFLHLSQQEVIDYYDRIENLEKKLDGRFFKCHRSYLVNLKYLKSYKKGTAYLNNGETIPVSRLRGENFSNVILQYMKEWRC